MTGSFRLYGCCWCMRTLHHACHPCATTHTAAIPCALPPGGGGLSQAQQCIRPVVACPPVFLCNRSVFLTFFLPSFTLQKRAKILASLAPAGETVCEICVSRGLPENSLPPLLPLPLAACQGLLYAAKLHTSCFVRACMCRYHGVQEQSFHCKAMCGWSSAVSALRGR